MPGKDFQMKFLALVAVVSLISIPVISISNLVRKVRSTTICPNKTIDKFSPPSLEVFLTINSLARVSWDGKFEKRRLELNWVSPLDREEEDYVALYHDDPLHNNQTHPLLRVPASYEGQYYLTSIKFPELMILHPALLPSPSRTMCLYNYWIAYVRSGEVLAVNCIKTQPTWMWEMKEHIGSIPLHGLMIPGTHNSGAYDKFTSYSDDTILMRYSVNQEEDVSAQLLMGIRYLDIRVSYFSNTP